MQRNLGIILAVLLIVLAACSNAPSPTLAPASTRAVVARSSPTRAPTSTATPMPTQPSRPSPTATNPARPTALNLNPTVDRVLVSLPTGEPVAMWNGIPIMPAAIAGKMDAALYTFSVKATPAQVQDFYVKELTPVGWELREVQELENNPNFLMLLFTRSDMLSISLLINVQGDLTVVLIVA